MDTNFVRRAYERLPVSVRGRIYAARGPRSPFTAEVLAREAIFVHVPKAAGTSLKREVFGRNTGGHRSIAEFEAADPERTASFFKFSFVRNPWDRLLASYSYLVQQDGTTHHSRRFADEVLSATPDFPSFVHRLEDPDFRATVQTKVHFKSQTHWVCLPGQTTHAMDFLGRVESLAADLATLRPLLDARTPPPAVPTSGPSAAGMNHARASRHEAYQEAYTDRMREIVAELYADDIALLGYEF